LLAALVARRQGRRRGRLGAAVFCGDEPSTALRGETCFGGPLGLGRRWTARVIDQSGSQQQKDHLWDARSEKLPAAACALGMRRSRSSLFLRPLGSQMHNWSRPRHRGLPAGKKPGDEPVRSRKMVPIIAVDVEIQHRRRRDNARLSARLGNLRRWLGSRVPTATIIVGDIGLTNRNGDLRINIAAIRFLGNRQPCWIRAGS